MTSDFLWTFSLAVMVWGLLVAEAASNMARPWSRPALVLYGTVGLWYLIDYLYNDPKTFAETFDPATVDTAFLQVCGFLIAFRLAVGVILSFWPAYDVPAAAPAKRRERASDGSVGRPNLELLNDHTLNFLLTVLAVLVVVALLRTGDFWSVVFPPLSDAMTYMWSRNAVGGTTDFLVSACEYTHLAVVGMIGALAVLTRRPGQRLVAATVFVLGVLPFLFQNARNRLLAVLLPAILSYFWGTRVPPFRKLIVAGVSLVLIWIWFLVILDFRSWFSAGGQGGQFFTSERLTSFQTRAEKQYGINMFEELCHIHHLMESGAYAPGTGERYFAELVAFIPRAVWPDKPWIGIDYAVARGFGGANNSTGVYASIATGMIGQGVVNFGPIVGPAVAATLAAFWVVILAHLWVQRRQRSRLLLFMLGLALTVNLGRDITLLVLFPFVFAYIGLRTYEAYEAYKLTAGRPAADDRRRPPRVPDLARG